MTTLKELFDDLPVCLPADSLDLSAADILEDSRAITPGSLFIARSGHNHNAVEHIPDAARAGAIAALCDQNAQPPSDTTIPVIRTDDLPAITASIAERFHKYPSRSLACVGITGTNGKTTVASLTSQLLNSLNIPTGCIGSIAVDTGTDPSPASLTTPFPLELSSALATMRRNNLRAAVMETSSIALHQQRCAAIDFNVAVFTNLTGDHLDYHTTMEAYSACKAILFQSLTPQNTAIVNIDDPHWRTITANTRAALLRCTADASSNADCAVTINNATLDETSLTLTGPWGTLSTTIPLLGAHNAMNALQALAAAWAIATQQNTTPSISQLAQALRACTPPIGRLEPIKISQQQDVRVFVDFAHTDDALANVLRTLRDLKAHGTPLTVVFGCGGDRDPSKRPRMGRIAAQLADRVIITSDNPRTENPDSILNDIAQGIDNPSTTTIEPDRAKAIQHAIASASPNECILIAGKGHETYQILPDPSAGSRTIEFSDQQHARQALQQRSSP